MGDKVTINEKEYDSDDVEKMISQGQDYTQKTQALSDKEKTLDGEFENLKEYKELDKYIKQHPDFAPNLNKFIKTDVARRYGYSNPEGNNQPNQNQNAGQYGQGGDNTNVGNSMYTPGPAGEGDNIANNNYPDGYVPPGGDTDRNINPEDQPMTRKEMVAILDARDTKSRNEAQTKDLNTRLSTEYQDLEKKGYNKEELQQIVQTAQKNGKFFTETAKLMAFDGNLADRFKEAPAPPVGDGGGKKFEGDIPPGQIPAGFTPLKGNSGSGFDLPDPEKDLVKYGNDPGEYLRQNPEKFILKE